MKYQYITLFLCGALLFTVSSFAESIVLDAVVASVNKEPITLQELGEHLKPPRKLTLKEASHDPEARAQLDAMIVEALIAEEAKQRKISVVPEEIDSYVDEVAKRNNMSRAEFENALSDEGLTVQQYKQRVQSDIVRTRITGQVARDGVAVSREEIDGFVREHPEYGSQGNKLRLSQIVIAIGDLPDGTSRTEEEARALAADIHSQIKSGADFSALAAQHSDGAEATEGGSLGIVAERDLGQQILDSILLLKASEITEPIQADDGFRIFKVEERFEETDEDNETLRNEARKILERGKLEERMANYFTVDLFKKFSVEKKI
jgi:peptidyl-prolyl cis-trans isomerase SurA